MSGLRLFLDEDAGRQSLVRGLRLRGFDVLTTFEAGRSGEDDRSQLLFASREGRAIYTFNVGDFALLHKQFIESGDDHAGIVAVSRQRYSVGEQLKRLSSFLSSTRPESMVNRMVFL